MGPVTSSRQAWLHIFPLLASHPAKRSACTFLAMSEGDVSDIVLGFSISHTVGVCLCALYGSIYHLICVLQLLDKICLQ